MKLEAEIARKNGIKEDILSNRKYPIIAAGMVLELERRFNRNAFFFGYPLSSNIAKSPTS